MNIPKGYKLVPVEPTEEMIEAGNGAAFVEMEHDSDLGSCGWISNSDEVMQAMLAAAPAPPQPIYDEAKERELFEAYASTHYRLQELPLDFDDGEYIEPEVQYSWESWEARAKAGEVCHE